MTDIRTRQIQDLFSAEASSAPGVDSSSVTSSGGSGPAAIDANPRRAKSRSGPSQEGVGRQEGGARGSAGAKTDSVFPNTASGSCWKGAALPGESSSKTSSSSSSGSGKSSGKSVQKRQRLSPPSAATVDPSRNRAAACILPSPSSSSPPPLLARSYNPDSADRGRGGSAYQHAREQCEPLRDVDVFARCDDAPSSNGQYSVAWRRYIDFCKLHKLNPTPDEATCVSDQVLNFAKYLIQNVDKPMKPETVNSYVSAVGNQLRSRNVRDTYMYCQYLSVSCVVNNACVLSCHSLQQ
jgi:hypothetical protein